MWLLLISACSKDLPAQDSEPPACATVVTGDARLWAIGRAAPGWLYEPTAFAPLCVPEPGEWLASHPESGQSVEAFRAAPGRTVDGPLVLAPLDAEAVPALLVELLAETLGVEVVVRDLGIDLAGLPGRIHPDTGQPQVFTRDLLARLGAARPEGAFAVLGTTHIDLAPGEDWNFVFGEAHYTDGVGVFSSARQRPTPTDDVLAFRRALHTLTHEALHMMGLKHCTYFECVMNGSNSLEESDGSPLHLCPVCLRKLELATGVDLVARYERLAPLYRQAGLVADAERVGVLLRRGR